MTSPDAASTPAPESRWRERVQKACLIYGLGILGVVLGFRYVGEQVWWLWLLLYLPAGFWLAPLLILTPMAWKYDRRMIAALALATATVIFGMVGWQWRTTPAGAEAGGKELRVISYNIGEDNDTSALPFVERHRPDLFLIQSMTWRGRERSRYQPPGGRKVHRRSLGAFELQSLHPITHAELLRYPGFIHPYGAIFRVDWEGEPLTVFSIHMLTPRADFMLLTGMREKEKSFSERARQFVNGLERRQEVMTTLLEQVKNTPGAVIVAGDFNMPAWGHFYQRMSGELTDAFHAVGRGAGFTFPAFDPFVPIWFGPWLRLDYLFCNAAWRPVAFEVEPGRLSQHRAIFARLQRQP